MAKGSSKGGGTKAPASPPKSTGGGGNGTKPKPIGKKDIGKVW